MRSGEGHSWSDGLGRDRESGQGDREPGQVSWTGREYRAVPDRGICVTAASRPRHMGHAVCELMSRLGDQFSGGKNEVK